MVEVQCTSCHTRYRINQRLLPDETPTFKCSRCGHVFVFEPRRTEVRHSKMAESAPTDISQPAVEPRQGIPASPAAMPAVRAALTGEPASEPPTAKDASAGDPLARDFEEHADETESGEHLTFGFENETATETQAEPLGGDVGAGDDWEIGGEAGEFARPEEPPAASTWPDRSADWSSYRAPTPEKKKAAVTAATFERVTFTKTPLMREQPAKAHSASLFLGIFLLVVLGFGVVSMIVVGAPAASADFFNGLPMIGKRFARPARAASLVALADVQASYAHLKDGRSALVIGGTARNVGANPLHVVEIAADLRDDGSHPLAHTQGYCGTNLSPAMVSQMTPREIEFLERIGPARGFSLAPEGRCSFALVFLNPAQAARHFSLLVAGAAVETEAAEGN